MLVQGWPGEGQVRYSNCSTVIRGKDWFKNRNDIKGRTSVARFPVDVTLQVLRMPASAP